MGIKAEKRYNYDSCSALKTMGWLMGLEPTTTGITILTLYYFIVLIDADRIHTNQQLTSTSLDKHPAQALIEILQFSANSLTSALTSWPM